MGIFEMYDCTAGMISECVASQLDQRASIMTGLSRTKDRLLRAGLITSGQDFFFPRQQTISLLSQMSAVYKPDKRPDVQHLSVRARPGSVKH